MTSRVEGTESDRDSRSGPRVDPALNVLEGFIISAYTILSWQLCFYFLSLAFGPMKSKYTFFVPLNIHNFTSFNFKLPNNKNLIAPIFIII